VELLIQTKGIPCWLWFIRDWWRLSLLWKMHWYGIEKQQLRACQINLSPQIENWSAPLSRCKKSGGSMVHFLRSISTPFTTIILAMNVTSNTDARQTLHGLPLFHYMNTLPIGGSFSLLWCVSWFTSTWQTGCPGRLINFRIVCFTFVKTQFRMMNRHPKWTFTTGNGNGSRLGFSSHSFQRLNLWSFS
jgi:hypothetical protein